MPEQLCTEWTRLRVHTHTHARTQEISSHSVYFSNMWQPTRGWDPPRRHRLCDKSEPGGLVEGGGDQQLNPCSYFGTKSKKKKSDKHFFFPFLGETVCRFFFFFFSSFLPRGKTAATSPLEKRAGRFRGKCLGNSFPRDADQDGEVGGGDFHEVAES